MSNEVSGKANFDRLLMILQRHYTENEMNYVEEGYTKLALDILDKSGESSLRLFKAILARFAADLKFQKDEFSVGIIYPI